MTLAVQVIAPDKTVWNSKNVDEVILPSTTGQLGILTGHAPLISALDIGVMRVRENSEWVAIAVMGGFAEVDNDEVIILVNGAERGKEIDVEAAEQDFSDATSTYNATSEDDRQGRIQASQAMRRARARYQAAGGMVKV